VAIQRQPESPLRNSRPAPGHGRAGPNRGQVAFEKARSEGRTLLTEYESKKLLTAYGIPTVKTLLAQTSREAAVLATAIGYPVVVKLNSLPP
jgi:acetyltransferase